MKKNAGFTLVELIVVIAILAILAGIAIPVYSGYITKAKEAADMQQLSSVKTAVDFVVAEKTYSSTMQTVTKIVVTSDDVTVSYGTVTDQSIKDDVAKLYNGADTFSFTFSSGNTQAEWKPATDTTAAHWELSTPATP